MGPVSVRQPRVNDRRSGQKFTSQILPPFMRRVPSLARLSLFAAKNTFFRGENIFSPFVCRGAFFKTGCGADLAR